MLTDLQREFIALALESRVLKFGDFTLKSGRQSPYFFNAGLFNTGRQLLKLGQLYAQTIVNEALDFNLLYGPAYKGIPLATAISIAMAIDHDRDVPVCFNRKEAKDHGEGGQLIGAKLEGRVLIVDDVISAGTSIRESIQVIRDHGASPACVAVALDREEQGTDQRTARQEIEVDHGMNVVSICGLNQLIAFVEASDNQKIRAQAASISAYRKRYGG